MNVAGVPGKPVYSGEYEFSESAHWVKRGTKLRKSLENKKQSNASIFLEMDGGLQGNLKANSVLVSQTYPQHP